MKLVVVGGIAAGLSAAARARRLDASLDILVLERGSRISYGACGLPYWIEGQVASLDDLTLHTPEYFRKERRIEVRTGTDVTAVRHSQREVLLASGDRIQYDKLVWAAGARPTRPARANDRTFVFHTDTDAERLDAFLKQRQPKTAAVVGGGYIGLELVTSLRARGLAVTLYHADGHYLHRDDDWLTKRITERLERSRVTVRLRHSVGSPEQLTEDVVLWAAGTKPNAAILAEAGADTGRTGALRVTDRCETSLAGVWAAGDCAETTHIVSGSPVWIPLGTTANKMGRVAGANAAGARERFPGVVGTSIVRVAGLGVGITGLSAAQARLDGLRPATALIEAPDRPRYFRGRKLQVELVADRGSRRLLGAAVAGDEGVRGAINVVATALAARMTLDDFLNLDLAYAPPYSTVMDPLLIAAQQLVPALLK
jgi:NADPH-dependent 2,4-dienoyl-CoA reductase/sulfur reductase-like enzyme